MNFNAESLREPANWRGRLVLFALYPLAMVVVVPILLLALLCAWPFCLVLHWRGEEPA